MALPSDILRQKLLRAGAGAVGFAALREVAPEVMEEYTAWLSRGNHGSMEYLANHTAIRRNPALLLDGDQDPRPGGTVICAAFPYTQGDHYRPGRLRIARYALGDDYHEVLRHRLMPVARWITAETGKEARVCVDTAPILERHWAVEAGLGFIGLNRQLIIPGHGSCFFLAEIVTRAEFTPDIPCRLHCGGCRACVKACPGHALDGDDFDCRRCHSYLTIEHRGELPAGFHPRRGALYGCDICIEVCPHNHTPPPNDPMPELTPRPPQRDHTPAHIFWRHPQTYASLLRHSAIKRVKLAGLMRNIRHLISQDRLTDDTHPPAGNLYDKSL